MLHLDTTLSSEILDLVVDLMYWFVKHPSATWTRLCVYFVTLHLFLICFDEIIFDLYCIQPPVSPSSSNFDKLFGVWNFFTRIVKYKQILSSIIGEIFNQVKIYSLDKFKVFSMNLSIKRLIMLIKIKFFCRMLVEKYQFSTNQK